MIAAQRAPTAKPCQSFHLTTVPTHPPEDAVALAILIAGFLAAHEVTEIRGKLSGRPLPWTYTDFPITLRKLRSTQLRIDFVSLHYLPPNATSTYYHSEDMLPRFGTADNKVSRLIVPITTSDAVAVTPKGELTSHRFTTGALCYVDMRREFEIRNADRKIGAIHLMMDVYGSDQLRTLIRAAHAHQAAARV